MANVLELKNVFKSFDGVHALYDVSLDLEAGEVCCLLGENGSGKSTLIKTLSGIHAPDSGEIIVGGVTQTRWRPLDAIAAGIGVIYQDFALFPNLTVKENLTLPGYVASRQRLVRWGQTQKIAARVLADIGVSINLDRRVEELSVAQRQLVAIGRTLLREPRLLVMDEPTSALTSREIDTLLQTVTRLKSRGVTVLFVSHKLDEVLKVSEHVAVLRSGRKVLDERQTTPKRAELVRAMIGRDLHEGFPQAQQELGPVRLDVQGLSRAGYFHDVSFQVRAGEILGVTGQLDSGRTALALALYGMLRPDAGVVTLDRAPVALNSIATALSHGVAMVPEDRLTEGVFLPRTVGENLSAGILDVARTPAGLVDKKRKTGAELEWLRRLSIKAPGLEAPVSALSGGNQQRVVLARALARKPRVLVLNGPTAGVDVGSKAEIHDIVEQLGREGMAVLLVSDDNEELLRLCRRILVMSHGRVLKILDNMGASSLSADLHERAPAPTRIA